MLSNESRLHAHFLALRKAPAGQIGYGQIGIFIAVVFAYGHYLQNRPDLSPWHQVVLGEEFSAARGEEGLLLVNAGQLLRLRSNPFLSYVEQRMIKFFDLAEPK